MDPHMRAWLRGNSMVANMPTALTSAPRLYALKPLKTPDFYPHTLTLTLLPLP